MRRFLTSHLRRIAAAGLLLALASAHAQTLTDTGTLALAIPIVMESTGMQPAEIEGLERETCSGEYGDATLPELRAENRVAVWLLEIHLAALAEALPAP